MAWEEMALELPHLAAQCQEMWLKQLRAPARLRPAFGERFLMSFFPPPPLDGHRMSGVHGAPRRRGSP